MTHSNPISDFQRLCQRYYICYSFAMLGFEGFGKQLEAQNPDPSKLMHVGDGHPDEGEWQGSIGIGDLLASSRRDGDFPETVAKSFLVAMYSQWDELYRPLMAKEHSVETKNVRSDLMGDLRLLRHCIVHKKSVLTKHECSLKALEWSLVPGPLHVSSSMFKGLINQVNRMQVSIVPSK